jgi:diketogulonate reductase-like aldo/keto reductase
VRERFVFAIAKAANPEHAAENAGAADLFLSEEEIARIDQAFPLGPEPSELPTL